MIDPLDPMRAALAKLTPTNRATTYGFAPPTTGHWYTAGKCRYCRLESNVRTPASAVNTPGAWSDCEGVEHA